MGVGYYCAPLLSDRLVDYSEALDVARLSFADSEYLGDAFDAVNVSRRVVCWLVAAAEGFLYGLVDNLCELSYGEVDDPCVLIYHFILCFVWSPEAVSNRPVLAS